MKITETKLEGCLVLEPRVFKDVRGSFTEFFNQERFDKAVGLPTRFVQDNRSLSSKGVVRALHRQLGAHAQAKLVGVLRGKVLDVAVDMRKDSATYLQHITIELGEENGKQLFIPKGFLHGFLALTNNVDFFYKCDNYYKQGSEEGIRFNDPTLNIDWGFLESEMLLSEKDRQLPFYKECYP